MLYFAGSFISDNITIDSYHYLLYYVKKKVQYQIENDEFKKFHIKNCTCYYFDDIIKLEDFDLDNNLKNKKPYENILIYVISHKTLIDPKPLRIRFNKIDGFIRIYDRARNLRLLGLEKY